MYIYKKRKLKKILTKATQITGLTIAIILFAELFGYVQQDHMECEVVDIYPRKNTVVFSAYGDNLYEWETDNLAEFEIGETYKVDFFDFEDLNAENNVIVKVHRNNKGNQ